MREPRIRRADAHDRDGIVALLAPTWRAGPEACARSVERALESAGQPDRLVLLAEHDGEVIAWARALSWAPSPEDPPHAAPAGLYLAGLSVLPLWRRRGVGRRLTDARLRWALERGAREIYYFADADNTASLALHATYGFEEITRDFHFPGTFDPSVPMILLRAALSAAETIQATTTSE